jgi:SAM-dependent methyltransferase
MQFFRGDSNLVQATSNNVFNEYGRYYDLLYRDKNYEGEAEYLRRVLTRLGVAKGALLEFGAGTGRHGRLLAIAGYDVLGVEQSEVMVERARSTNVQSGFSIMLGDIRAIQLRRVFDAVTALFHVISYQIANEDVLSVFRNARTHLTRGGIFVFDVWYAPAVMTLKPSVRETRVEDEDVSILRRAEPDWDVDQDRVDVHYKISVTEKKAAGQTTEFNEVHTMRYFSLPELDLFAGLSGFKREIAEEFLSGANLSSDTWGACIALRAI